MRLSSRAILRNPVHLSAALVLAASVSFGARTDLRQAQARVIDHAELLCSNCLFAPSDYYYCFAVDDKILIGYQRAPVLNWRDKSKNYLTKFHHAWLPWAPPEHGITISYDEKHLWVVRPGGKHVKLIRDYSGDVFTSNSGCRQAVKVK